MARKPKLGTGQRFRNLTRKTKSKGLSAWIGREKYGQARFQKMAAKGRGKK